MKYNGSIDINKPQDIVAALFADPNNLKEYQDGFIGKELISGQMGQKGAISKMYYKQGKREMELIETITENRLPDFFAATYHHKHMDNTMECRFIPIDENNTKYMYEYEYTRVSWILPKLMILLFPGMFKKHVEKWIKQFKEFAEKN